MDLIRELRSVATLTREVVGQLPGQLDRWARDRHRPQPMDENTPWCFTCKQPWPCDKFVELDAQVASRSGEQPPPPPPGSAGSGGGINEGDRRGDH